MKKYLTLIKLLILSLFSNAVAMEGAPEKEDLQEKTAFEVVKLFSTRKLIENINSSPEKSSESSVEVIFERVMRGCH